MALNDARSDQLVTTSLGPAARTNGTANGTGADLARGHNATIHFIVGTITDGTHVPTVEESDLLASGYTTVAAGDLAGTLANLASNVNQKVGYIGKKRFVRAVSTVSGATTGGVYAAAVVVGDARKQA